MYTMNARLLSVLVCLLVAGLPFSSPAQKQFGQIDTITTNAPKAQDVEVAQMNGDTLADIVSASREDNKIAWYEQLSPAGFSSQKVITTNATDVRAIDLADLDGDGDIDIAYAAEGLDEVGWIENQGGGSFSALKTISDTAGEARDVVAADLDADGDVDVAATAFANNKVAWYENMNNGGFSGGKVLSTTTQAPTSIEAAHLVSDSLKDLLVVERSGGERIEWYDNSDSAGFSTSKNLGSAFQPNDAVAADLDGDGDTDVLGTARDADEINVYEKGGPASWSMSAIATFGDPKAVAAADVDGDGDQDALACGFSDNTVEYYENLGDTAFATAQNYAGDGDLQDTQNNGRAIHLADVENDGDIDVVAAIDNIIGYFPNKQVLDREDAAAAQQQRRLSVAPNPTGGRVQLRGEVRTGQPLQLRVRDLRGRLVAERRLQQPAAGQAVALRLPQGVYSVTLTQGEARSQHKLLVR